MLHQMLYGPPPPNVGYNIKVLYSMVIPAMEPLSERWHVTQLACVRHGPLFLDAITSSAFLQGGAPYTRRSVHKYWKYSRKIYKCHVYNFFVYRGGILYLLKLVKLVLTALGHFLVLLGTSTANGAEWR